MVGKIAGYNMNLKFEVNLILVLSYKLTCSEISVCKDLNNF